MQPGESENEETSSQVVVSRQRRMVAVMTGLVLKGKNSTNSRHILDMNTRDF